MSAERLVGLFDEIPGVAVFAQIGRNGDDLAAGFLGDFIRGCLDRLYAPRTDRDVDAFLGRQADDAISDAFAAA
jgi:hypothetical protein